MAHIAGRIAGLLWEMVDHLLWETPKLKELKVIRFQKGSNQLFSKKAFIEKEFQQCEFLNSKLVKDTADDFLPESRPKPRGINQKRNMQSSCSFYTSWTSKILVRYANNCV